MLERYYVKPVTVDHIRANVAGAYIEHYVEWMQAQGYSARNVFRRVPLLCQFGDFASRRGATDGWTALEYVEPFVRHWQSVHGRSCKSEAARARVARDARNPVRQMLELALHGVVEVHRPHKPFPFEAEVPGFVGYLRDERGLKLATVQHYAHYLNGLHRFIERAHASVASLSPALLAAYIVEYCAGLSRTSRRDLCGTLRVFLRYCYREHIIDRDLGIAVQPPQAYRLAHLPRAITWDEVRRMLNCVDRRAALGRKYQTEAAALRLLDAYVAEHRIVALEQTDSRVVDAFLASRPREHARSYNHLVGAVRRFFDWALMQGMIDHNPVIATPRRVNGQRIPYLFSLDDAKRLLGAARELRSWA